MTHPIYRVVAADIASDYALRIRFDDGIERIINFRPVLAGELFGPLRDLELFTRLEIDKEAIPLPCTIGRNTRQRYES